MSSLRFPHWAALAFIGVGSAGATLYYVEKQKQNQREKKVSKAHVGGPWTLVDQDGIPRTSASYHNKYCLIYFGFTHCPDICPSEMMKVGQIMDGLPTSVSKQIVPLFISIDPHRDTIKQMKEYGKDFHPSIQWLVGTPDQILSVSKSYRVYRSIADKVSEEEYVIDHSMAMHLVGPGGDFVDFYIPKRMQIEEIMEKIREHVKPKLGKGSGDDDNSSSSSSQQQPLLHLPISSVFSPTMDLPWPDPIKQAVQGLWRALRGSSSSGGDGGDSGSGSNNSGGESSSGSDSTGTGTK